MRGRWTIVLTTALLAGGSLAAVPAARADSVPAPVIYVDDYPSDHCSDTAANSGSAAVPYCTVQAAADVVVAGQTVQLVGVDTFSGQVTVSHSGTADKPIKFVGGTRTGTNPDNAVPDIGAVLTSSVPGESYGLVISGASYVTFSGIRIIGGTSSAVLVTNSSHIRLEQDSLERNNRASTSAPIAEVDGGSSDVTIDRSYAVAVNSTLPAVQIDAGAANTTVSENIIQISMQSSAVSITGATNTAVTGNTVWDCHLTCYDVSGAATGTSIENNILSSLGSSTVGISVSADSAPSTSLDYNIVNMPNSSSLYSWAGTSYASAAALNTKSGQGAHDLDTNPDVHRPDGTPLEGSPAISSADANAPGELPVDYYGNVRSQDPADPVTGTGVGYYDRGAVQLPDPMAVSLTQSNYWGAQTDTETLTTAFTAAPWSSDVTYYYDFGDGATKTSNSPTATHTYTGAGRYTPSVTVTDAAHGVATASTWVAVGPGNAYFPLSPTRVLDTRAGIGTNGVKAKVPANGNVVLALAGVGGFPASGAAAAVLNVTVTNPGAGGYITVYPSGATMPTISNLNFTAAQTVPNLVTVKVGADGKVIMHNGSGAPTDLIADLAGYYGPGMGSAYNGLFPARVANVTATAGSTQLIQVLDSSQLGAWSAQITAVALNVTVANGTSGGYLTVYPEGAARPTVSNLNYTRGEARANSVIVPVSADGNVNIYDNSTANATVKVLVDVQGYYVAAPQGGSFIPVDPTRIIDTRKALGTGGVAGPVYGLQVRVGSYSAIPPNTTGPIVLNVTVVKPTGGGYLSVYPGDAIIVNTSNINFAQGETVPNLVMASAGSADLLNLDLSLFNQADIVTDLFGYFVPAAS